MTKEAFSAFMCLARFAKREVDYYNTMYKRAYEVAEDTPYIPHTTITIGANTVTIVVGMAKTVVNVDTYYGDADDALVNALESIKEVENAAEAY